MASNADDEIREDDASDQDDASASRGNWLGRWVLIFAIVAFLVVYVIQLARGSGLLFTIIVSAAAMGIVGVGGMMVRQILLRTASNDRAAHILEQMREISRPRSEESEADEEA